MSLPRKLTRDEILAATKEELRIAIAERLGWKWGHPVAGHVWADGSVQDESEIMSCLYRQDNIMWRWGSIVPDTGEYPRMPSGSCVLPDWPNDIAEAYALEGQFTDYTSRRRYWSYLSDVVDPDNLMGDSTFGWAMIHATAEQRCRAWMLVKHEG